MGRLLAILLALLLALLLVLVSPEARAEKRVALVIGNAAYQSSAPLQSARNDAADMAALLAQLGFEVIDGADLDKRSMERTIRHFGTRLVRADLALFFYAGHGLQAGEQNYLMPTDARLSGEGDVDFETIPLTLVLKEMQRGAKTSILLLDACRENPVARNLALATRSTRIGRGLAEVRTGVDTLVGFATQPGNVAVDSGGRNSVYTAALLKHVGLPGRDATAVLSAVRSDVLRATDGKQVPWEHTALTGEVYFGAHLPQPPAGATLPDPAAAKAATVPFVPDYDKEMEIAFWNAVKDSRSPTILQTYLDRFPRGNFAELARVMIDQAKKEQGSQTARTGGGSWQAATPPPAVAKAPEPPADNTPAALARALQSELKRVGCDPGAIEGSWGPRSREALRSFERHSKLPVPSSEPSDAALQLVAGQKGRICPLECSRGETEIDGKCVTKARDASRSAERRQRRRPERDGEAPPPTGGIGVGVCVGSGPLSFCTR